MNYELSAHAQKESKVEINKKPYLLRVMVNETVTPPKVVTVYRTSKINKYWNATT